MISFLLFHRTNIFRGNKVLRNALQSPQVGEAVIYECAFGNGTIVLRDSLPPSVFIWVVDKYGTTGG